MSLDKVFFLDTSRRYAKPEQTGDKLPIVYGDLSSGTRGIWILPKIQKWDGTSTVYCYANHAVQPVVNGNVINVYKDNVLVTSGTTFDDSVDFEAQGIISTITFDSEIISEIISVTGNGKDITNIIDIIDDFLINEVNDGFTANDFDATTKATAKTKFDELDYVAAGVLNKNQAPWKTLAEMMSTFKGGAYLNGANELKLVIEDNTDTNIADILPRGDITITSAKLQRINLINRVPCEYSFNYISNDYSQSTNALANANEASINIFGTQTPTASYKLPWSRDIGTVHAIQKLIIDTQSVTRTIWEVSVIDNTLKRIGLEVGDIIVMTFDFLFKENDKKLINELFRILEIAYDFNQAFITFRAIALGKNLKVTFVYGSGIKYGDADKVYNGSDDLVVF